MPGGTDAKAYVGVIRGPVLMKFSNNVEFSVSNIRVLSHPVPLLLIGSDILRGGREETAWNFNGLQQKTVSGGRVEGELVFAKNGHEERCPLIFSPS